jgi:hypothetical protein
MFAWSPAATADMIYDTALHAQRRVRHLDLETETLLSKTRSWRPSVEPAQLSASTPLSTK